MSFVSYYTFDAISELRYSIESRTEWYTSTQAEQLEVLISNPIRTTEIQFVDFANRLIYKNDSVVQNDGYNAMVVFEALSKLTPHQASDERLWTYICHTHCKEYVVRPWLQLTEGQNIVDRIKNHFFVNANRGLVRDNGISRLWWLGYIAHKTAPKEPERFLEVILYRQDVRAALIERPSVSRNYKVLRTIYEIMKTDFATHDRTLFRRSVFRKLMMALNRRGGMILLDSLSEADLEELVKVEADIAINEFLET